MSNFKFVFMKRLTLLFTAYTDFASLPENQRFTWILSSNFFGKYWQEWSKLHAWNRVNNIFVATINNNDGVMNKKV